MLPRRKIHYYGELIANLTQRDILGRYKGSLAGVAWAWINPIILLMVYTFVFTTVFKARWTGVDTSSTGHISFSLMVYCGLIVHGFFSECFSRAPGLILSNPNYVKKVVFPIEILPIVAVGTALFHLIINLAILLIATAALGNGITYTALWTPLVLLPLILVTLGVTWATSALGVYLKDIGQVTGFVITILMFLSPVFYPISALPEIYRPILLANPLTMAMENLREVVIMQQPPDYTTMSVSLLVGLFMAWLGYGVFAKTRGGFADVI